MRQVGRRQLPPTKIDDVEACMTTTVCQTQEGPQQYSGSYATFAAECAAAGFAVHHYNGRMYYVGPAVFVNDSHERDQVVRATSVRLQYDQFGKEGYVVYPA